MKQTARVGVALALSAGLVVALAGPGAAQRRAGRGQGPAAPGSVACPYGFMPGQGLGLGAGRGGWWNRVQPTTEEGKALVAQIAKLHQELRQMRADLARLSPTDPGRQALQDRIAAKVAEVQAAHTRAFEMGDALGLPPGICGLGAGRGGWWNRAQPTDPAAKAQVDYVRTLHDQLRAKRLALAKLAPSDPARAALQKEIDALVAEVQRSHLKAWEMGDRLGFQPGQGRGLGAGMGRGRGRGMGGGPGLGLRAGLNPYCPFNQAR